MNQLLTYLADKPHSAPFVNWFPREGRFRMGIRKNLVWVAASAAFMLATATGAVAQEKKAGSGPNPFTDCGIGAALFPDTHWAAVTSNVIWDAGTTAVISATASPETCEGASAEAAQFIFETYDSVVEETARGSGDHLTALLEIYGCGEDTESAIISAIRPELGELVRTQGYSAQSRLQKSENYFRLVDATVQGSFAGSCSV